MQPLATSSVYDPSSIAGPLDTAGAATDVFSSSNINVGTDASPATGLLAGSLDHDIAQAGAYVLEALTSSFEQSGTEVAAAMGSLSAMVQDRLSTLDVTDTADVMLFQSTLEDLMAMSMSMPEFQDPALGLMAGIADTASAALSFAKADPALFDPTAGADSISLAASGFSDLSQAFEPVMLGQADYVQTGLEELTDLMALYPLVAEAAMNAGIQVTSLMDPSAEDPDAFPDDGLGTQTSALDMPLPEEDPITETAYSDPNAQGDPDFADMMAGDPLADVEGSDSFGLDDLLPDGAVEEEDADATSGFADMMAGETMTDPDTPDDMLGEDVLPDESSPPTLDTESSVDNAESDANQDALEARFQNLYVTLMEKQISFKEAVEAYKTDNQNAGKG